MKQSMVIALVVDNLIREGLPLAAKLIEILARREKLTDEELEALKGELDARSYFKQEVKE